MPAGRSRMGTAQLIAQKRPAECRAHYPRSPENPFVFWILWFVLGFVTTEVLKMNFYAPVRIDLQKLLPSAKRLRISPALQICVRVMFTIHYWKRQPWLMSLAISRATNTMSGLSANRNSSCSFLLI